MAKEKIAAAADDMKTAKIVDIIDAIDTADSAGIPGASAATNAAADASPEPPAAARRHPKLRRFFRRWWFLALPLIALLLFLVLPYMPNVTEIVFSRGIFVALSAVVRSVTRWIPFSLAELLLFSSPVLLGLIIWKKAWRFLAGVLCVASLMYMLLFGVNYYRVPLPGPEPFDDAYLTSVCIDLADKMSAARALTKEDANGCMVLSQSKWETVRMMGGAKPVLASHWWSYTGIAGMYFPFFAEANVNIDMPDCDIPATTAHELAHVYGRALEDEANFLAYMNTRDDTRADIRYSGLMLAYIYCSNALYETNQDLYNQVAAHVSAGVWRDFAQRSAYWKQFEGPVQDASTGVNNAFITGQGDANGVRSYDRVVLLIVGQYQREGFEG